MADYHHAMTQEQELWKEELTISSIPQYVVPDSKNVYLKVICGGQMGQVQSPRSQASERLQGRGPWLNTVPII